jgi:hypothetical protein
MATHASTVIILGFGILQIRLNFFGESSISGENLE